MPAGTTWCAVQAVCFVNEQYAAQGALDHAVGQGGGVAGVAAYQIRPAHLQPLRAAQGPVGLQAVFAQRTEDPVAALSQGTGAFVG